MNRSHTYVFAVAMLSLVAIATLAATGTPVPDVLTTAAMGSLGGLLGISLPAAGLRDAERPAEPPAGPPPSDHPGPAENGPQRPNGTAPR